MVRAKLLAELVFVSLLAMISAVNAQSPPTPASDAQAPNLQVRYADARLRLAELDLERAAEMNRRISNSVPPVEVKRLEEYANLARKQLNLAHDYTHGSTVATQITAAEAAARVAEQDLKTALKAKEKSPGTIPQIMIRRREIRLEMAKIRVQLWNDASNLPTLVDGMQWQIDRLTDQIMELNHRLDQVDLKKISPATSLR